MLKKLLEHFSILLVLLTIVFLLSIGFKGQVDKDFTLKNQTTKSTSVGSPFESSGSNSRYALTEAIVEDNTVALNIDRAKFASPDVVKIDDKYYSIFTPGVSFLGVPFYKLGDFYGLSQVFTYTSIVLIALLNLLLVINISKKLGAENVTSILSGILFIFGTNALSYTYTFTQHHLSTFIVLLALNNAFYSRSFTNNFILGVLVGLGLLVDIPNVILMLPLLVFVFIRQFKLENVSNKYLVNFKINILGLFIGLVPLMGVFGYYNFLTSDSYTTIAQFVGRTKDFSTESVVSDIAESTKKGISLPFNSRGQWFGFYIFTLSMERSFVIYSPIVLIGLLGLVSLLKSERYKIYSVLILSVILINLTIYSLFGDPTGSWAFGPRYIIPALALLSCGVGVALTKYKKIFIFVFIFNVLAIYSVAVNVLGATTTTLVPPKSEAVSFSKPIPYTYEYNWQLLTETGLNSSLFYNTIGYKYVSPVQFVFLYSYAVIFLIGILYIASFYEKEKERK